MRIKNKLSVLFLLFVVPFLANCSDLPYTNPVDPEYQENKEAVKEETEEVTEDVIEEVTEDVIEEVTEDVIEEVTEEEIEEVIGIDLDGFVGWTKNPSLDKDVGLWWVRTFCWTIGGDCPDDLLLSKAEWEGDGDIFLKAEDDNTDDLGCDCAAMTQGEGFDGSVRGHSLTRIRTGDLEAAYIILKRSDFGATPCSGVVGAGNIINLWLRNPDDGSIWVTDLYFETVGLNAGFDERPGPHNELISRLSTSPYEKGLDWYAYQIEIRNHPEYWTKKTYTDGSELLIIDLKALLDHGSDFSERDLTNYVWHYVDLVCEDVCVGGEVGESASWQRVHHFEIKLKLR